MIRCCQSKDCSASAWRPWSARASAPLLKRSMRLWLPHHPPDEDGAASSGAWDLGCLRCACCQSVGRVRSPLVGTNPALDLPAVAGTPVCAELWIGRSARDAAACARLLLASPCFLGKEPAIMGSFVDLGLLAGTRNIHTQSRRGDMVSTTATFHRQSPGGRCRAAGRTDWVGAWRGQGDRGDPELLRVTSRQAGASPQAHFDLLLLQSRWKRLDSWLLLLGAGLLVAQLLSAGGFL